MKPKLIAALAAFFLSIIVLIVAIVLRKIDHAPLQWWEYADVFFVFIAAFAWLVSVLFKEKLPVVARKMSIVSQISLILAFVAYITSFFLLQ